MSDHREIEQEVLQKSLNQDQHNIKLVEEENESHKDTHAISINTSQQFQHIDRSLSPQASSTFNNLEASEENETKQQGNEHQKVQNQQQPHHEQKHQSQQAQEQQTQQIKPQQTQLQEKPQLISQPQPQVDYQTIVSVKIFQKKINDSLQLKTQGNQFFKASQYKQAIEKYSQGLRLLDPQQFYGATQAQCQKMAEVSASLLFNIGSCFFNINSWKKAEIYFTETITINPDHIKAIYKRALCRHELQNYEDAMTDIKLAFSKDKSNIEIHKSYEKILEKYNEQVKKDKQNMKEISSKIFRTDSQKSIPLVSQQQKVKKQEEQQGSIWGTVAPLLLLGGAALFLGYKKWFSK